MRIPLDYYRILGLPTQATPEQLQQAHRDRSAQLPRREFSDSVIAARRQLLDQAYGVLLDPEQRQVYEASLAASNRDSLSPTGSPDKAPSVPSLEIRDDLMPGALLLLLELGEYELVFQLSQACLVPSSQFAPSGQSTPRNNPDVVLTQALAALELGREQWQQGKYEAAALSLQQGQELLLREGLFASVRGEIQAELYKLRPYRILELLALQSEDSSRERQRGLLLLQEMLEERGGIDGSGNDRSGLNIDDFLRFIQQLRSYLSAAEQQALFEDEARRPSAVATYLAVYALLARGFAQRQPALIRRARGMLVRLGQRQDVHLEQSVCALLLGQTEEANRSLELSREYKPLAFIRQHSQGSPDLLPGLCLYGERWLQDEVFPHFRDLANQRASLKDYFADDQVQAYLEALPMSSDSEPEWNVAHAGSRPELVRPVVPLASGTTGGGRPGSVPIATLNPPSRLEPLHEAGNATGQSHSRLGSQNGTLATSRDRGGPLSDLPSVAELPARRPRGTATIERPSVDSFMGRRPSNRGKRLHPLRILFVVVLGLLLFGIGVWILQAVVRAVLRPVGPAAGEQPVVHLERPLLELPPTTGAGQVPSVSDSGPLTAAVAEQVIQAWQAAKARAMGSEHDLSVLDGILSDPSLSEWQTKATNLKDENAYWQYELKRLDIEALEINGEPVALDGSQPSPDVALPSELSRPDAATPAATLPPVPTPEATPEATPDTASQATPSAPAEGDVARVVAVIGEARRYFADGTEDSSLAADSEYRAEYELVRQGGKWLIRSAQALE